MTEPRKDLIPHNRRLAYEPTARIEFKKSGNSGDGHIYVFIGGTTCIAAIWAENEATTIGEYDAWKRVWKTTVTPDRVWPSFEVAARMSVQDLLGQSAFLAYMAGEIDYFKRTERII